MEYAGRSIYELGVTASYAPQGHSRTGSMLYLIGGAARAGKSTIARAMLTEAGVPYLGVDYIKMAFAKAMPDIGIDPNNNDLHTARQLWSFVEAMGEAMIENDQDYTLEAAYILPEYVDSLLKARGNLVRACFVGFERIETSRKIEQIKAYRGQGDDWLYSYDDDALANFVNRSKDLSSTLRAECETLGLRYFDGSDDFHQTVNDAVAYLLNGKRSRRT